jgi:hypothetical protein
MNIESTDMSILYRIKPTDKKSIEAFYDVFKRMPDGTIKGWSVKETYRWGQGFVENEDELPYSDDKSHYVDPTIGWGCELDDLCACWFEFDDSFTDEEKAEVEKLWYEGDPNDEYGRSGAAWLYDGEHDWEVEEDSITIYGPFAVDKIDENVYNESIEVIELKPRPPFVATTAWPFGDKE